MHPLVQSAIEAARQGNNAQAMDLIKQVLSINPKDVDGWLVMAAVLDQPDRKRQCLERVLDLDPTNQTARDKILEIDRAAMGGPPLSDTRTTAVTAPQQERLQPPYSPGLPTSPLFPQTDPQLVSQNKPAAIEKTQVFKYPTVMRTLIYLFMAVFGFLGLIMVSQNPTNNWPILALFILSLLLTWAVSPEVELNEAGIRATHILTSSQANWDEITQIKSNAMRQNLELTTNKGRTIKIPSQLSGYPHIVEILRQRRPDLFGAAATARVQGDRSADHGTVSAFTGTKVFKKSFLSQYRSSFLAIPMLMITIWAIFRNEQDPLAAGLMVIFCLYIMISPMFEISQVKMEPNRLTIEKTFGGKEYSARQIASVSLKTGRGRYGRAVNYVSIQPANGKAIALPGFSESGEVIYGFLMNWWNSYRNS
jgi:hypothetical protein